MRQLSFLLTFFILLSCNNNNDRVKDIDTNSVAIMDETIEEQTKISNTTYSQLYKVDDKCKLKLEEVATIFAFNTDEMKANIEAQDYNPCAFMIDYKEGGKGPFSVKVLKTTKTDNQYEIKSFNKKETYKKYVQVIDGHTIYRHPNQGYYKIMHPDYDNQIKVQFRAMLGVKKEQFDPLREKGLNTVRFLIAKYQD